MIYLDSWVWLEFGLRGERVDVARDVIEDARRDGGAVSTIGVTEIEYVLTRDVGREAADHASSAIEDMDEVPIVPVSAEIAQFASSVRTKYYDRRSRELSYADAIHVATAALLDCSAVHTGDSDFDGIDEIEAVVHPT